MDNSCDDTTETLVIGIHHFQEQQWDPISVSVVSMTWQVLSNIICSNKPQCQHKQQTSSVWLLRPIAFSLQALQIVNQYNYEDHPQMVERHKDVSFPFPLVKIYQSNNMLYMSIYNKTLTPRATCVLV